MSKKTLELVMKLKTGEVNTGLDKIESRVEKMIDKIKSFSSAISSSITNTANEVSILSNVAEGIEKINLVDPDDALLLEKLNEELSVTDRKYGNITDRNIEAALAQREHLDLAIRHAEAVADQVGNMREISKAQARRLRIDERIDDYINNVKGSLDDQMGLIKNILSKNVSLSNITNDQYSHIKGIVNKIKTLEKHGINIEEKFGLTKEHLDKLELSSEKVKDFFEVWDKSVSSVHSNIQDLDRIMPGIGQFADLLYPLQQIGNEIRYLNEIYEANHQVSKIFVSDLYDGKNASEALTQAARNATTEHILLSESQEALSSILESSGAAAIKNSKQLENLTTSVAQTTRATGISSDEIANLATRMYALTDSLEESEKLMSALVNIQTRNRLSLKQMSLVTGLLNNNLQFLNTNFSIMNEKGETLVEGGTAVASMLGEVAKRAKEAGGTGEEAMKLFARAMEDPISVAPLLGSAVTSNNPSEVFVQMGERATHFFNIMKDLPPIAQREMAKSLGVSYEALKESAQQHAELRKEVTDVNGESAKLAKMQEILAQRAEENTDKLESERNRQEALANATRKLSEAFDQIRKTFIDVAIAMQPVMDFIAAIISHPIGKWSIVAASGILALVTAFKALRFISIFPRIIGNIANSMIRLPAQGGGAVSSLASSLKNLIKTISEIRIKDAVKASANITLIGAGLAAGVASIALAAQLLPPNRAAELFTVLGSITAISYMLIPLSKIGSKALIGAAMVGAVGGALGASLAIIGGAMRIMPENKIKELSLIVGGLLVTTGILAAIGAVAPAALAGAIALTGVAGALSLSVYLLAKSSHGIPKIAKGIEILGRSVKKISNIDGSNLALIAAGVAGFVATLVGAEVADYLMDFEEPAEKMASSLRILSDPLKDITTINKESAGAFLILASGLNEFSDATGDFWERDYAGNARELGKGINSLVDPIHRISQIGAKGASSFRSIGAGMKDMADALKGSMWDVLKGDVHDKAEKLSNAISAVSFGVGHMAFQVKKADLGAAGYALSVLIDGIKDADDSTVKSGKSLKWAINEVSLGIGNFSAASEGMNIDTANGIVAIVEAFKSVDLTTVSRAKIVSNALTELSKGSKEFAKAQAEELKTSLSADINVVINDEITTRVVSKLDEVITAINDKTDEGVKEELSKISDIVSDIMMESSSKGGLNTSMADMGYNS